MDCCSRRMSQRNPAKCIPYKQRKASRSAFKIAIISGHRANQYESSDIGKRTKSDTHSQANASVNPHHPIHRCEFGATKSHAIDTHTSAGLNRIRYTPQKRSCPRSEGGLCGPTSIRYRASIVRQIATTIINPNIKRRLIFRGGHAPVSIGCKCNDRSLSKKKNNTDA